MEYIVIVEEYYNHEFDFWLYENDTLVNGDLEPDLTAQLCASGVIEPMADEDDQGEDED